MKELDRRLLTRAKQVTTDEVLRGQLVLHARTTQPGVRHYGRKDVRSPYEFVYNETKKLTTLSEAYNKGHNLWIQTYAVPRGREEEIIEACEAAYDAGARTLLAWGYRGSESNNYAAENPEKTWLATVEGMRRIRERERDRLWEERRRLYCK